MTNTFPWFLSPYIRHSPYTMSVCFLGFTLTTSQNQNRFFCLGHRSKRGRTSSASWAGQRSARSLDALCMPNLSPPMTWLGSLFFLSGPAAHGFHIWLQCSPDRPPSTPGTTSSPAHPCPLHFCGVTACSQAFCSESLVFLCFSAGGCRPTYFLIALCPETVRSGPACPKPTFLICAIPLIPPACTPNSCSTNPGRKAAEYRTVLENNLPVTASSV